MEFFSGLINEFSVMTDAGVKKVYPYDELKCWKDIGYNEVILKRDTAYELSGTGFNLITSRPVESGVIVVGDDLGQIKDSRNFARVSLVQLEDGGDEQTMYNLIRKVEYVKYHYFPEGYMMRTASRSHTEAVRVSKKALTNGISFEMAGNLLIKKYMEIPAVRSVKLITICAIIQINPPTANAFKNPQNISTYCSNIFLSFLLFCVPPLFLYGKKPESFGLFCY